MRVQCDYCSDMIEQEEDCIDRCKLCWEHHYNLLNPEYAAKNPIPPHKALISRSSLPKLPDGWTGPFRASNDARVYSDNDVLVAACYGNKHAQFLADLLNAVYGNK